MFLFGNMYILYTDGKFEYVSEDSVLTYTPLQLSDNQSLATYNGQISTVSVINGNASDGFYMSNHYVLTIELSGIITGPCLLDLRFQFHHTSIIYYNITKNITFNGIQPFSLTIPIYNELIWFYIRFEDNTYNDILSISKTVNARITYIVS